LKLETSEKKLNNGSANTGCWIATNFTNKAGA